MWYFRPSVWLPLKLLLVAWLLYSLAFTIFYSGLRTLAAIKVVWAVPAAVSVVFAVLVVWFAVPAVASLQLSPIVAYVAQLASIPAIWRSPTMTTPKKVGVSALILVVGYVIALVLAYIGVVVIGW